MLRGKTLEEIINKWTTDLEGNVREFDKFAAEVAAWDRALIENGNNVIWSVFSHQPFSSNFYIYRLLHYTAMFWPLKSNRMRSMKL